MKIIELLKVIELLHKIANGEQPKHIRFDSDDWYWGYDSYIPKGFLNTSPDVQASVSLFKKYRMDYCLNDEVEVIEESKKIEKITYYEHNNSLEFEYGTWTPRNLDKAFARKINEIIEKVEELDEQNKNNKC